MRRLVASLVLCTAFVADVGGQAILGTYVTTPVQGGGAPATLVLQRDAQGKVTGSLSGNGVTFSVIGEMRGEEVSGLLVGGGLRSYFEARRAATQLRLLMADLLADGKPNYTSARTVTLVPRGTTTGTDARNTPGANPMGGSSSGAATGGATGPRANPQDQQLASLLTSSAWCSFGYSGSSTYSGTSGGTTQTSRAVFRPDGLLSESKNGETTNSGSAGSAYGRSSSGEQVRWKVENGQLLLSSNGVQWIPQPLKIERNSSGYPIITTAGKEYMMCR